VSGVAVARAVCACRAPEGITRVPRDRRSG
jgi:hypothetical protein